MAHFRSAQVLAVVDRPMDLTTVLQKLEAGEHDAVLTTHIKVRAHHQAVPTLELGLNFSMMST